MNRPKLQRNNYRCNMREGATAAAATLLVGDTRELITEADAGRLMRKDGYYADISLDICQLTEPRLIVNISYRGWHSIMLSKYLLWPSARLPALRVKRNSLLISCFESIAIQRFLKFPFTELRKSFHQISEGT